MKQPVVLRVYKGDKLESVRQFEHSQIVIGRNTDVQLQLQDEGVALLHAMIEDRGGEYFLSDLGSQNGTFKNGNRVLEDKIASGDDLTIGPFRIQFFVGIPKPAAPPKPMASAAAPAPEAPPQAVTFTSPIPEPPPVVPADVPPPPTATKKIDVKNEKSEVKAAPMPMPAAAPAAAKKPAATAKNFSAGGGHGAKKTFAPANPYKDLKEIVKPQKGSLVEVLVTWNNKILSSNHFNQAGSVYISSNPDADVIVPIISSKSKFELLKISGQITLCLTQEMTGELIRDNESVTFAELARQNKIRNVGTHFELDIRQGEMVRVGLQNDLISIYVRYIPEAPKPLVAPLLDMSSSEVTGIILALAVSMILGLYMNIYTPSSLLEDEAKQEEPIRKAIVKFQRQEKPPAPPKEEPPPEKKVVKVVEQKKPAATPQPAQEKKADPGKAAQVAPNPNVKPKPNKQVSAKPGAAIKTANKDGANMKAEKPDPTKVGLLGVFSSKGTQKQIDKAYSGSGELQGMADAATGTAGSSENRDGDNLGSKIKDAGSGKGSATVGLSNGVGTQGRGTGNTGYGTGGIGQKGNVAINVQGQEGEFSAGMDKEAIRRVIREHIREIRSCYERELQRSPDLYGKIVLQWDIEEGGRVGHSMVKSNALGNDRVANCILSRLRTWKFPDPPKDQIGRVDFPFVFSSQ
ncbi:MAG: FHA domain-containing protein [Bdellovibrionales bacterium]|nr:FHA domain-containing protein [Bdellovibrionales bacterium]